MTLDCRRYDSATMSWWVCKLYALLQGLLVTGRQPASPHAGAPRSYIGLGAMAVSPLGFRSAHSANGDKGCSAWPCTCSWLVAAIRPCPYMPQAVTTDAPHIQPDSLQPLCRCRSVTRAIWVRGLVTMPHGRWRASATSMCCRRAVGYRLGSPGAATCWSICRAFYKSGLPHLWNLESAIAMLSGITATPGVHDLCVLHVPARKLRTIGDCWGCIKEAYVPEF